MQEILKQKSKNKKPKTFGAVNNAYEIYHLVQVAITEDFMLSQDTIKSDKYSEYIRRTKYQLNTLAYNLVERLKLNINIKKSYITKSTRGFVFMQQKYFTFDNKLIVTPVHKKFTRERRKLKAYKRCLERGEVLVSDITLWYKSWKCAILKCGYCRKSVFTIDKYFHAIYDNVIQINNKCFNLR